MSSGKTDNKGYFCPIGYHSETLPKTTKILSATEREMYAIVSASRKWKTYCHGSIKFITDHQPNKQILNPSISMATQEKLVVKKAQGKGKEIQKAIAQLQKQGKIKPGYYKRLKMSVKDDILYKGNLIVIPLS